MPAFHPRHLKATNLSGVIAILFTLSQNGIDAGLVATNFGTRWVVTWHRDADDTDHSVNDDTVCGAINKALDQIDTMYYTDGG